MKDLTPEEAGGLVDELMRAANPVPIETVPTAAQSLSAQAVYSHITGRRYRAGGPKRRRWTLAAVAAIVVAAAGVGTGGAYAGLFSGQVGDHVSVLCYAGPSLSSKAVPVLATADGPVPTCLSAWNAGELGRGPAPLLVACVTHQGVAAVFPAAPGADVCGQLGLPPLPAGAATTTTTRPGATTTVPTTVPVGDTLPPAFETAIITELSSACYGESRARTMVVKGLQLLGSNWTVDAYGFSSSRPCASPGFDEANHTVHLIGIPPTPSMGTIPGS